VRGEQRHLYHDSSFCSFRKEITIAREVFEVPLAQIEFVSPARVPRRLASRPRRHIASWQRRQVVSQNPKRLPGHFQIGTAEQPRVIKAIGFESRKIAVVVEIGVHYRAVVLAAGNQYDCLAVE